MKFVLWNTFTAGTAGTVALTLIIRTSRLARITRMPRFRDLVGSVLSEDRDLVRLAGRAGHFFLGIAFFGPIYGVVFANADSAAWPVGLAAGIVHGLVAGLVIVPLVSLRRAPGLDPVDGPQDPSQPEEPVAVPPGGLFGIRWGPFTPIVILAAHASYGVAAALIYDMITPLPRF